MGLIDGTQLIIAQAMNGAAARQQVLANNIANANTAGFTRSDVDFQTPAAERDRRAARAGSSRSRSAPRPTRRAPIQSDGNNVTSMPRWPT